MSDIVTLRNVYGKIKEVHFQPGVQKNGVPFPFVKKVRYDSFGNAEMILSSEELNDPMRDYFIPEDMDIIVTDGTTFDLENPLQKNIWESIKDSDLIAPTRDARDANGALRIDGDKLRYGMAEFYVDIPGRESEKSVSKKQKITKAWTFIEHDSISGQITKCKLLGKEMYNTPTPDITNYLYERAEKNPDEIIELYTSSDMTLKLLIIDAKKKNLIRKKDGLFMYAENILGATDDAMILFFKTPSNKKILDAIKYETYPEYSVMARSSVEPTEVPTEVSTEVPTEVPVIETPIKETKKSTSKK